MVAVFADHWRRCGVTARVRATNADRHRQPESVRCQPNCPRLSWLLTGYGDIAPTTPLAQMVVVWEAVIGQAYLTIIVARLVGLHLGLSPVFRGTSHQRSSSESHRD
ncbi:MAG: potassium channel family protein [Planctomycetota bacterium]